MMSQFTTRPEDTATDANAQRFMMQNFLMQNAFVGVCTVVEVFDSSDFEMVTIQPLVEGFTGSGDRIQKSNIYGVPVWRLQRGSSAVKMPPVVGDIGVFLVCDRDISGVKATKESSLPGSNRTHNPADAIYLGGVFNGNPTQYVEFLNDGIDILSPLVVRVDAASFVVDADKTTINSPTIELNGAVTQGAGQNKGDFNFGGNLIAVGDVTAKGVSLSTHTHSGVETGDGNTGVPN